MDERSYSAESHVDVPEDNGCGGDGVSYNDEETIAGATRDRLIEDDTRLYKSGVNDRTGVENSNFGGGCTLVKTRPTKRKKLVCR